MPKFYAKVRGYNSYRTVAQYPSESNNLKNATVRLTGDVLYVPKMKKGIKLIIHRNLPENAHICNVTEGQSWMLPDLFVQRKTTNRPI